MKKILYTGIFAISMFTQVSAQELKVEKPKLFNIELDTRFDLKTDFDSDYSFQINNLKVILSGEIRPGIRYKIRQRLNKPQEPLGRDNASRATDHAFLEFDAGKDWTFTVGKQSVKFGTFEYDHNPADIYLASLNFNDLDAYKLGVNAAYKYKNQIFNLQVVNADAPQFASESFKNKGMGGLFMWEGNLFNGLLNTRYGVGMFQYNKHKGLPWVTIGNRLNLGGFRAELDWYRGKKHAETLDEDVLAYDESLVLNLLYNIGKFTPQVKGILNYRKLTETDDKVINDKGIQFAVEYRPFEEKLLKDLRFHAVYFYSGDKVPDIHQNVALVGVRWLFKIN